MLSSHPISIGNKRPLTAAGMRLFLCHIITTIWQNYHRIKSNGSYLSMPLRPRRRSERLLRKIRNLKKKAAAAQQVLASVPQGTAKWKTAEANLKAYKKQISQNNAMLLELNKQVDDESRSLVTNNL